MLASEGFLKRTPLSGSQSLAEVLGIDRTLAEETIQRCCQTGLLAESQDANKNIIILPVSDPETLTIDEVEQAFAKTETKFFKVLPSPYLEKITNALKNLGDEQKNSLLIYL